MTSCVHLEWTPTGCKNMPQGPYCRLAHHAGVISCEAPLLVVSRGGKEVVGGAKKDGQGERFHSHQGRPWQFPGLSFLPVHRCALLGLASISGHSLLLDHLEFHDDHVSMAHAVLAGKPSMRGTSLASSFDLGDSNDLFYVEAGFCFLHRFSSFPLGSSSDFRLYLAYDVIQWVLAG